MSVFEEIIKKLEQEGVDYEKFEHESVFTSEQAAKIRGTNIHQGAKALVLQADRDYILYVLPADLRADLLKLQENLEVKKLRMASKDSVKAKTGLDVGCIPPFGSLIGLKSYVDTRLSDNPEIAFNAGSHSKSIKMKYEDFVRIEEPEIISL